MLINSENTDLYAELIDLYDENKQLMDTIEDLTMQLDKFKIIFMHLPRRVKVEIVRNLEYSAKQRKQKAI